MKITWLGQAGLLFEKPDMTMLVDPYLSDSCAKVNPNSRRRMPVDKRFLQIKPDIIVCTHNHLDHLDPETLRHYLTQSSDVTVLVSAEGFKTVKEFGGNNRYVMLSPGTEWTEKGLTISAVRAEHSERSAVGVIIDDSERKYYVTGDTLYNNNIFNELPDNIFAVFLPVNGRGNNMNMTDAARFAVRTGAQYAVPLHWGMFDDIDPKGFSLQNKAVPEIYKEIKF